MAFSATVKLSLSRKQGGRKHFHISAGVCNFAEKRMRCGAGKGVILLHNVEGFHMAQGNMGFSSLLSGLSIFS